MKAVRWLVAAALVVVALALATAALLRPYADNQRNWLFIGAGWSGLASAAVVLARSVWSFAGAVIDEWRPRA